MPRKPPQDRHPALLGVHSMTEDGRHARRPRTIMNRVAKFDRDALEALPGYTKFTPSMQHFLMVFPTTGYNMSATARLVGKQYEWVTRARKSNPAFAHAIELRRDAIPTLISSFMHDMLGTAFMRHREILEKDSGAPAAQKLKAIEMVYKGTGIAGEDEHSGVNTYINANTITMNKGTPQAPVNILDITQPEDDDDE